MLAMTEELAMGVGIFAVLFLGLAFPIVLAVRSVPNKLLLLGFLMTIMDILLAVFLPETAKLAFLLLIPAVMMIFLGVVCLAIVFAVKLLKADNKEQPPA